jgi:AAA domain
MSNNLATTAPKHSLILNTEDWLNLKFLPEESEPIIGTAENPIIRPRTKNLIQAQEKAFKTTFLMRLLLGLSSGETVFPALPVVCPHRVTYLHGELAAAELKDRLESAASGLKGPLGKFFQGRSLAANLVTSEGQKAIEQLVEQYQPEILALDPWQSFIAGSDENSFKDVSEAAKFMDRLIAEYGLSIFLVIHVGKNPKRGARGHSFLSGWRDTKIDLKRDGNKVTVKVEPRWAKPPEQLTLMFGGGTLLELGPAVWTDQAKAIRSCVRSNGGTISRQELADQMFLFASSLRMALKRAQDSGAIVIDGDTVMLPSPVSVTLPPSLERVVDL